MLNSPATGHGRAATAPPHCRAFSLPEVMVAMAVFFLLIGGLVFTHLFGLRMFEISKAKLGASDDARQALNLMMSEIRSARLIRVGQGALESFTECATEALQEGNSVQVYPTLDTNLFVRYFWDTADQKLKRTTNGSTAALVVASSITNGVVFRSEDAAGNVLTNNFNNRVISLTLQFYQLEYPTMAIGPGHYYDFYQLRTRITRRTLQ